LLILTQIKQEEEEEKEKTNGTCEG